MVTDPIPRSIVKRTEYDRSDKLVTLELPLENRLPALAREIEAAMSSVTKAHVRNASNELLTQMAGLFNVPVPSIRVLDARP